MKFLMILGLILGANPVVVGYHAGSTAQKESSPVTQKTKRLELSIVTDRQKYKENSRIRLTAMLTNVDYVKDIFVYYRLGWGYLSSLTYTIRDASGKLIHPTVLADDLPFPIARDDNTYFVKLAPEHFLGTALVGRLDQLNLRRPGKYSISVEYHSPISSTGVDLNNFWSKEDGTIRSNVVHIQVLP